ncbi:MAG: zinc ribbon domain-containing protein [Bacillota bacterium]
MTLISILGTLTLIVAAGALILLPLISGDEEYDHTDGLATATALSVDGAAQLRDLEYDYRMGKMNDDDYRAARGELSGAGGGSPVAPDDEVEAELEAEIEAEIEAELEAEVEAAVEATVQAELGSGLTETPTSAAYCPQCGARLLRASQRFCHQCGKRVDGTRSTNQTRRA